MPRFVSLKTKISLFLITSAVVLMASLLSFLYFSGRKNLLVAAHREMVTDARLFAEHTSTEITNSFLELTSLRYQLEPLQFEEGKEIGREDLRGRFVTQFLTRYARKYRFLLFKKSEWSRFLLVRPVKIFGGEIRVQFDWEKHPPVPVDIWSGSADSLQWTSLPGQIFSRNRLLFLKLPSTRGKAPVLLAALSSDALPERVLRQMNLPSGVTTRVTESSGLVLFSPLKSEINRLLGQARPQLNPFLKKNGFERIGRHVYYSETLGMPPFHVIFEKDLAPDFAGLNATVLPIAFFAGGVLLLVLVFVWIMAKGMTDTLEEVSLVAGRVAQGDFSRKISIRRRDEVGVLIDTFNTMIDRTRSSYRELQKVNRELSEKVDELTRTRAKLLQKERLAIIGETVSKISHEIQNKIGGVSIWLQNLEMELKENKNTHGYIEEMKKALRSFLDMLAHFKRFYREPKLEKQRVLLPKILDAVLQQLTSEIQSKNLTIERSESRFLPELWADPGQLEEALSNIVINAIYYSAQGGTVKLGAAADAGSLQIVVADQGPGVDPNQISSLFQPFFTTKSSGSGLGLAIADSIVRAHGGKISVENAPGSGARFTIQLPFETKTGRIQE